MSFFSDSDFRKGAVVPSSKKPAIAKGTIAKAEDNQKSENVVERAKIERETRAKNREQAALIIKIQSWWRGRSTSSKFIATLRKECDSKMSDISKLSAILLSKNNISFVPPVPICLDIAKKLTAFGFRGMEVNIRTASQDSTYQISGRSIVSISYNSSFNYLSLNNMIHSKGYETDGKILRVCSYSNFKSDGASQKLCNSHL